MKVESPQSNTNLQIITLRPRDLNEAWFQCIREVLIHGYEYTIDRGSYEGHKRKEFDLIVCQVMYPGTRPLIPVVPEGVPPPTSMEFVEGYLPYLMTSAPKKPNEQYTYGEDLESQIASVISMYRMSGFETNQACMSVGSKQSMLLDDPQCLRLIDTRVRYGRLHFVVYFRSWDLWAGFPSNLAAIQLMKEYMASEIGVGDGGLTAISKGLHLYDFQWELGRLVTGAAT